MSLLSYRCPGTSNDVTTGIDTDAKTLRRMGTLKVAVSCIHCPDGHIVSADNMFFTAEIQKFQGGTV